MNKRMLKHSVTAAGACRGNGSKSAALVAGPRLDMEAKRELIEDSLEGRSTVDELANQGIYQVMTRGLGYLSVRLFAYMIADISWLKRR